MVQLVLDVALTMSTIALNMRAKAGLLADVLVRQELFLPRFKFETRYYLERNLSDMGMADAFSELKADFSGMDGSRDLRISHVIHQAMIDVNEEGSEAAAATAVVMTWKSMPEVFRADRPFLFLIMHKPTNSILFMGRVSDPPRTATASGK